jgi:branched-chain amino acid aminotransferase
MSMADRDGKIWMDGEFLPWRDANIHILTHSLHYGLSVFEGVRAYATPKGTAVFRLQEHTRRLFYSAKIFRIEMPFAYDTIVQAQCDVLRENHLSAAYIRPLVWFGTEAISIAAKDNRVHVAIAAWPWNHYLGQQAAELGIRVKTSSFARHHVNTTLARAKASGHYINSILANQEATCSGYDEALLLDTQGFVSEGAGENVFIVRDNTLYTPDLASCLDGITRDSVIRLARDSGYTVHEKRISRDEIYCADEAFFTGTAVEIIPIRELDDRVIGDGRPGPVTRAIQKLYFSTSRGENLRYDHWLTLI